MARSLLDLATRLEKVVYNIDSVYSNLAVSVALTILGDLVYKTPVDTSQALSNWQVSLRTPTPLGGEIPPYHPGLGGWTRGASAQEAIRAAKQVLSGKKPGDTIYLSNVLDYIVPLNEGSSTQQAAGFVERAVLLGRIQVKKRQTKLN